MAWPQQRIDSWDEFLAFVASSRPQTNFRHAYLFRGQSDARLTLTPSMIRVLPAGTAASAAIKLEGHAISEFKSQAHLHLGVRLLAAEFSGEDSILHWLALMQHYGAPTRLLDWTTSIFVAAYFAVEKDWDIDGAIFYLHPKTLTRVEKPRIEAAAKAAGKTKSGLIRDPKAPEAMWVTPLPQHTQRLVAQQGTFTLCSNILGDHHSLIDTALAPEQAKHPKGTELYWKLTIGAGCKPTFFARLREMNISANALFPGIDGLGRMIAEVLRLGTPPA